MRLRAQQNGGRSFLFLSHSEYLPSVWSKFPDMRGTSGGWSSSDRSLSNVSASQILHVGEHFLYAWGTEFEEEKEESSCGALWKKKIAQPKENTSVGNKQMSSVCSTESYQLLTWTNFINFQLMLVGRKLSFFIVGKSCFLCSLLWTPCGTVFSICTSYLQIYCRLCIKIRSIVVLIVCYCYRAPSWCY